jgi:hypothetical protein
MMFVVADRMMRVVDRMMVVVISESAQGRKGGQASRQDQQSQHATNRHKGLLESIERIAGAMGGTL